MVENKTIESTNSKELSKTGPLKGDKIQKCCLCGEYFDEFGNNPWPLSNEGRCCDLCNWEKVIPARVELNK